MKISPEFIKQCKSVENQIEFYSMKRSGHHIIMDWIFAQIRTPILFFNDVEPYVKAGVLYEVGSWKNPLKNNKYKNFLEYYSFNYEDAPIQELDKYIKDYNKSLIIKPPKNVTKIFIIRDPFNLFASRLKFFREENILKKSDGKETLKKETEIASGGVAWYNEASISRWCEYAEEFLGDTSYYPKKFFINYNRWCHNLSYRKSIAKPFIKHGSYTDIIIRHVPPNGRGSSFDFKNFKGKGHLMKTDERWKLMIKDPEYLEIINNKKLLELSQRIYPELTQQVMEALSESN